MPRTNFMSYVASQKRWIKQFQGKTYSVSCKQLGCATGKDASWVAANSWWEAKEAELNAQQATNNDRPHPCSDEIIDAMRANLGVPIETDEQASDLFRQ